MKPNQLPVHNLRAIYIRSSTLFVSPEFDPTIAGQALHGEFRHLPLMAISRITKPTVGEEQLEEIHSYDFVTAFEFRYAVPKEGGDTTSEMKTVASVIAEIVSSYTRNTPGEPTKEELQEYGKTFALVHVWPYWREHCQTSLNKMFFPATMIPLLQLEAKRPTKAKKPKVVIPAKAMKSAAKPIAAPKRTAKKSPSKK